MKRFCPLVYQPECFFCAHDRCFLQYIFLRVFFYVDIFGCFPGIVSETDDFTFVPAGSYDLPVVSDIRIFSLSAGCIMRDRVLSVIDRLDRYRRRPSPPKEIGGLAFVLSEAFILSIKNHAGHKCCGGPMIRG